MNRVEAFSNDFEIYKRSFELLELIITLVFPFFLVYIF